MHSTVVECALNSASPQVGCTEVVHAGSGLSWAVQAHLSVPVTWPRWDQISPCCPSNDFWALLFLLWPLLTGVVVPNRSASRSLLLGELWWVVLERCPLVLRAPASAVRYVCRHEEATQCHRSQFKPGNRSVFVTEPSPGMLAYPCGGWRLLWCLIRGFGFSNIILNFAGWESKVILLAEHFFCELSERKLSAAKIPHASYWI